MSYQIYPAGRMLHIVSRTSICSVTIAELLVRIITAGFDIQHLSPGVGYTSRLHSFFFKNFQNSVLQLSQGD